MNRGILGLGILVAFLAMGLWGAKAMSDFHEPVSQQLDHAAQVALAGDLEEAVSQAKAAQKEWEDHWHRIAILADHTPMDEIDSQFSRLEAFASAGCISDFAACCSQLSTLVSATAEAHTLTWWNLL